MPLTAGVDDPLTCSRCAAMVTADELGLGLAVRINGEIVCPSCIELLPQEAQLSINRVRAMKGLGATTYRIPHPLAPKRTVYSFSTAALLNHHRRTVAEKGAAAFPTPVLPPPSQRRNEARRSGARWWWIAGGAAAALAGGAAWWLLAPGAPPEAPPAAAPIPAGRQDLPTDPLAAWSALAASPQAERNRGLRSQLVDEIRRQRQAQLDAAELAIGEHRFPDALSLIGQDVPDAPEFRDLGERSATLRLRVVQAMRDIVTAAPPPPPPPPPPATGGQVAAPATSPAPAPAPAPARPGPTIPDQPGAEQWMLEFKDLERVKRSNTYRGSLPLISGGSYQVWLRAPGSPRSAPQLTVQVSTVSAQVSADAVGDDGWVRAGPAAWQLPAGEPILTIEAAQQWRIDRIYIAGTGFEAPTAIGRPKPAPAVPAPTQPAAPVQPDAAAPSAAGALNLAPIFPEPGKAEPALDGSVAIPSPWPSPDARFLMSAPDPRERKHTLTVRLPDSASGGGVVIEVARGNPARTRLRAIVEVGGKEARQTEVAVGDGWNPLAIDLTGLPAGPAALRLVDIDRRTDPRPFLAGPAAVVAGRAPTAADRILDPALLLPDVQIANRTSQPIARLLKSVSTVRRQPAAAFEPERIKILAAGLDRLWMADVRRDLGAWLGRDPADRQVAELGVAPDWWKQIQLDAERPHVDPEQYAVVVLAPSGRELGLGAPERIADWARGIANLAVRGGDQRRGGLLPVIAIGPLEAGGPDRAALDAAWAKALPMLAGEGVPVIDLRLPPGRLGADEHRKRTAARLVGGLRNLAHQLRSLRDYVR